jgi:hypothetical protein
MANGDQLDAAEEVVRAGMYPYWDQELNRGTPSAFTLQEVSVSRPAVLDFPEIVSILQRDFDARVHPEGESMAVQGTGVATVQNIIQQAQVPMDDGAMPNVVLTVVEDPIPDNPAHALICGWDRQTPTKPRKITRGVAKRLVDIFKWEPLAQ